MGWKLVSVKEMKSIEAEANERGKTYDAMMQDAGEGLACVIARESSLENHLEILGLVGPGNNGGDTLVALRALAGQGFYCRAYLSKQRPPEDNLVAEAVKAGVEIFSSAGDGEKQKLVSLVASADIILDGLLGTGISLPLRDDVKQILGTVNQCVSENNPTAEIYAVDCPSGVDCDSGQVDEDTLYAAKTICMEAVKTGLIKLPAYERVGELDVVPIGLPADLPAAAEIKDFVVNEEQVRRILPKRPTDAHKGTFGTALVVAGSVNFSGAAALAGKAAYRSGAGLVTLAVPSTIYPILAGNFMEATWLLLPDELGAIMIGAEKVILDHLSRTTAILLGPGWGTEETTLQFLSRLLKVPHEAEDFHIGFLPTGQHKEKTTQTSLPPMVIDADGLKLLAQLNDWPKRIPQNTILTPHPGEMSILTGLPVETIQVNRLEIAREYAQKWNCVVILKGAFTVIADPNGRTETIPVATPALARAGTGDVLAGIIVGLLAQRVPAFDAAAAGAWIHAQCGLAAENMYGNSAGVLAGDLLEAIPYIITGLS